MKWCNTVLRAMVPLLFLAGLLVPGAVSPPAASAVSPCHAGPVTLQDLLALAADEGPLAKQYDTDPMLMSEAALECYGAAALQFTAFVRDPGDVGWTYTWGLQPGWFRAASFLVASTSTMKPGYGPITALAIPPDLGNLQAKHVGHWVVVAGHFDDPAAATCTATGDAGVAPSAPEAVAICRSIFVVSAVSRTSAPATSTAVAAMELPTWWSAWLAVSAAFGGVAGLWITGRRRRR
jgi:hypothetical protein